MNDQNPLLPPEEDPAADQAGQADLLERLEAAEARAAAAEEAAVAAQTAANDAAGVTPRYAVYDLTYEKFVGEVVDKKPTPAAAKKIVGHDDFEIREV